MIDTLPIYPMGIKLSQTWREVVTHFEIIARHNVRLFVELGVHHGGLAALMLAYQDYNSAFRYLGVEIDRRLVDSRVARPDAILYGDCLNSITMRAVKTFIDVTKGPACVFCDNGNKPAELKAYAPLLRPGDFISVHDYGTEITDSDFDCVAEFESLDGYGLPVFRKQ